MDTIARKDLTFVGPLNLVQGGVAVIARYPVFKLGLTNNDVRYRVEDEETGALWWGFATVLCYIEVQQKATITVFGLCLSFY